MKNKFPILPSSPTQPAAVPLAFRKVIHWIAGTGICAGLLIACLATVTPGCQKARLFVKSDSLPATPGQFHFFNAFSYDTSLDFSVDGLLREKVRAYGFSAYYPSLSAFNEDPTQPDSKLLQVYDPTQTTEFQGTQTFQFLPNTSYLVYPSYSSYDTSTSPEQNTKITLNYIPEDIDHPVDGTARVRMLDMCANTGMTMTITPNMGAGTSLSLPLFNAPITPTSAPTSYYGSTDPGQKMISVLLTVNSNYTNYNIQLTYLPVNFNNSQNYTFIMTGDGANFIAGLQPRPRLFLFPEGDTAHLQELTLSSLTYPGNLGQAAQVTVVDDAFNLPGLLTFGVAPNFIEQSAINVNFNSSFIDVNRWPIVPVSGGVAEDVGDELNSSYPNAEPDVLQWRMNSTLLVPNTYLVSMTPGSGFTPVYGQFDYNFEQGISYTLCMLPDLTTSQKTTPLVLENDQSPDPNTFRVRVINLLAGSTPVDVHIDSLTGPLLASSVPYAQPTNYAILMPSTQQHNLYVTAAGTTTPLFQNVTGTLQPIPLSFNGGNSGTVFIMGLLPGTPYSGDPGSFGPYAMYHSDASVNPNAALASQQLYFSPYSH